MHTDTHVLISHFYRDNRGIAKDFARPFGVDGDTCTAWGRPKQSDLNPSGTGKGNPLDQGERFINIVHAVDPARAREMAQNFVELVDELDRRMGAEYARATNSASGLLAKSICEHADIAAKLLSGHVDRAALEGAMKEITEAETALLQLKGGVGELLNNLLTGGSTA